MRIADPLSLKRASLDSATRELLCEEAESRRAFADLITIADFSLDEDGALRGRRHVSAAGPGPLLNRIHQEEGLDLAREAADSDVPIYPTRASYLYYDPGDFALLHHDVSQCTVTILAALGETADPLFAYPSFGRASEADAHALNEVPFDSADRFHAAIEERLDPARMESFPLDISSESMVALPGRDLLHARYPQETPVTVLALCYSALAHKPSWS